MFDLDKLSYEAYGELVIGVLIFIAILLNLFPFSFVEILMCISQIPIYLFVRANFDEPIHAIGLNVCFVVTIFFYILLFVSIKAIYFLCGGIIAFIISSSLTILACYATSTMPNKKEMKGKLFFGYKKHNDSKYNKLIEYIKFNGLDSSLIEAEERLKNMDSQIYLFYKRKFREDKTFKEIADEFEVDNPRIVEILDKAYFYIIGALKI